MKRPTLTEEQLRIVEADDGAYLLTAPPGSGKTEVLVQRTIHLLQRSQGQVFRILALTYTVRAAGELRTRVEEVVDQADRWRVTAMTFHAFCLDLLENYGEPVGITTPVTVFDDDEDKRSILEPVLGIATEALDRVSARDWKELFAEISRRKVDLVPPEAAEEAPMLGGLVTLRAAYDAYEAALANASGVDFEGMLFKAVELLANDTWIGEHYRRMYRHVLVDEGQEMNAAQYELLRTLCGTELRNVMLVADADQSINSFAGGGPEFLARFKEDFVAKQDWLTTNFRSARRIVAATSQLAAHIESRPPDAAAMSAATLAQGWVGAQFYSDELAEAEGVAQWIGNLLQEGLSDDWVYEREDRSVSREDVCIQGRTRYSFDRVVESLQGHGIPVLVRTDEGGLFDSRLGKLSYYALRLIESTRDLPSRRRFIAELAGNDRAILSRELEGDLPLAFEAFAQAERIPRPLAQVFIDAAGRRMPHSQILPAITSLQIRDAIDDEGEAMSWATDQQQFNRYWTEYQMATRSADRSIGGFLKLLGQMQRSVRDEPGVRVLTPHRARGLSFRVVVILGMSEGTFPFYKAKTDAEIDEERRAVYVAASRAARVLLLTRPGVRENQYGRFAEHESRFVGEMGLSMDVADA